MCLREDTAPLPWSGEDRGLCLLREVAGDSAVSLESCLEASLAQWLWRQQARLDGELFPDL